MNLILNRDFKLPEDGWFHIAPLGEFTGVIPGDKPQKVMQVVDKPALELLKNRFDAQSKDVNFPGLLVDFDHFSSDTDKPSEAAGWINALENRADGLWAQIRFSDVGEAAVKGGRYRLVSPVWDHEPIGNGRVRPTRLVSVALTNDPNLKGLVPLSNRQTGDPGTGNPNQQPKGNNSMDYKAALLKLLGLPAEATDDQISAATTPALENMGKGKNYDGLKNRHDELLNIQADGDLVKFSDRITEASKPVWKAQLISNRGETIKLLEGITPAKDVKAPIHNRTGAKLPGANLDKTEDDQGKEDQALAARISNRASEIEKSQKISFNRAHALATQELCTNPGK